MNLTLTTVFQEVSEGYIGFVEELPGANAQGKTLAEARVNLEEAVTLVLEANRVLAEEKLADINAIRQGIASAQRGELKPAEQVVAEMKAKYGLQN